MNLDHSLLFCYLEEDNIQRAYFRVRPLLTVQGDIRDQAMQLWPNEGSLRIVPDRNEQHTFKLRMRTLGAYCVVDLRDQPVDAGKIRTNKNFRPDKGEVNQYILYSDTVHELPEHSFYQIVTGTAGSFAEAAKEAVTPLFFIRENDTLYGPVRKASPAQPDTAKEAEGILFSLPCPDGATRLMLCMDDAPASAAPEAAEAETVPAAPVQKEPAKEAPPKEAPAPAPEPEQAPEALPIAEKLVILDEQKSHEETIRQLDQPVSSSANLLRQKATPAPSPVPAMKPTELSGTPLVPTPLRVSTPQAKNRTQEVVRSTQWAVGKYEPPAANLPGNARMRDVANPVEAACTHLRTAWSTGAHEQLADFMLSLQGVRSILERKLCGGDGVTLMQRVLRDRLQDLEAERLTALCELDRARRDVDAYKQELIHGLASRIARETDALNADRDAAKAQAEALKQEINALTHQKNALQDRVAQLQATELPDAAAKLLTDMQMLAPMGGVPLRMSPIAGQKAELDELVSRMMGAAKASGVDMDRNTAVVLTVLFGQCDRIGVSCATPAPLVTLMQNIMNALGWQEGFAHQYAPEQRPLCGLRPVDATPAVLATSLPNYAPLPGVTKVCLSRTASALIRNAAYDAHAWPVLTVPALPFVPEVPAQEDVSPVSFASVQAASAASTVTDGELDKVLAPILDAAIPMSGAARKALYRFVSACAGLLEGGLPVAVDWALTLWVVPALERGSKYHSAVKPLLDEYPLALSRM